MIVYLARAIQAFVMYCVNGTSRSSLLIESTDSMIESTDSMILIESTDSMICSAQSMDSCNPQDCTAQTMDPYFARCPLLEEALHIVPFSL